MKVSIIIKQEEYDHAENENTFRSEKTISYYKIRENKKRTGRKSHILTKKTPKRKSNLRGGAYVNVADAKNVKEMLQS